MSTIWVLFNKTNPMWAFGKLLGIFANEQLAKSAQKWFQQNPNIKKCEYEPWDIVDENTLFTKFIEDYDKREIKERRSIWNQEQ